MYNERFELLTFSQYNSDRVILKLIIIPTFIRRPDVRYCRQSYLIHVKLQYIDTNIIVTDNNTVAIM